MLKKPKQEIMEKRKYIRLKSVFPVEFRFLNPKTFEGITKWQQGFTSNVSKGGMCLTVNNLEEGIEDHLVGHDTVLDLTIHIPLAKKPISARAKIVWSKKPQEESSGQYLIGLTYTDIQQAGIARIMGYARWLQFVTQAAVYIIAGLVLIVCSVLLYNFRLRLENRRLINNFVDVLKEDSAARDRLKAIQSDKTKLDKDLAGYQEKIKELEQKLLETQRQLEEEMASKESQKSAIEANANTIKELQGSIADVAAQRKQLESEISNLNIKEDVAAKELDQLEKAKTPLEEQTVNKMYQWLALHQNSRTGLVVSFEGDAALNQWAFTYDQALAAQAYTIFGDKEKAQAIFNFYKTQLQKNNKFDGFVNACYANSADVAEYVVHCGPNIWLGIAILKYTNATSDAEYLPLAVRIASWLISIQEQDPQGGIKGGPNVHWFATEHNLDAFAFFNMLYKITKEEKYNLASRKVLSWLERHAYDKPEPPIKRGKGDATIATDTYAWSIAALGPAVLQSLKMNPDEILQFAVDNCEVKVNYKRPDGQIVEVRGFDFAKYRNLPRGGIISSEWSAQMILAFKIMSRFYRQQNDPLKANDYQQKAQEYLNELGKLIISSPSAIGQGEGCLPYATAENADTGHGWRTPFGNKTGCIAGTAYTIFAYRGYNPLEN